METDILKPPHDASSYQGTIVKVLPNDNYYKKYWNKKHYLQRAKNINGIPEYILKESNWYGSIFYSGAIENIHFLFIKGNLIYNNIGETIGVVV